MVAKGPSALSIGPHEEETDSGYSAQRTGRRKLLAPEQALGLHCKRQQTPTVLYAA
jgi:hypothetical protein